jgi:hypothetical protein
MAAVAAGAGGAGAGGAGAGGAGAAPGGGAGAAPGGGAGAAPGRGARGEAGKNGSGGAKRGTGPGRSGGRQRPGGRHGNQSRHRRQRPGSERGHEGDKNQLHRTAQQVQELHEKYQRLQQVQRQLSSSEDGENKKRLLLVAPFLVVLVLFLVVVMIPALLLENLLGSSDLGTWNPEAIPVAAQPFVPIYRDAATVYGVNPFVLMAIHERETSFGTSTAAGVHDGVNFAGCCAGPMQFSIAGGASNRAGGSGGTWAGYAHAYEKAQLARPANYPNQYEPHPNVYDSYDAIYAAASYLHALHAGPELDERTHNALLHYGGTPPASAPYADAVINRAKRLEMAASLAQAGGTGEGAGAGAGNGFAQTITLQAAINSTPARSLARVVAVADAIHGMRLTYCFGAGHGPQPGPSSGTYCYIDGVRQKGSNIRALDCSGAVRWLLVLSGFADPGGRSSGTYGSYLKRGEGPGFTIYYNPDHIYAVIAGRVWQASPANAGDLTGWGPARAAASYTPGHVEVR